MTRHVVVAINLVVAISSPVLNQVSPTSSSSSPSLDIDASFTSSLTLEILSAEARAVSQVTAVVKRAVQDVVRQAQTGPPAVPPLASLLGYTPCCPWPTTRCAEWDEAVFAAIAAHRFSVTIDCVAPIVVHLAASLKVIN